MRTILKFPIPWPLQDRFDIEMPNGADVLTVQTQDGRACIWAAVDPEAVRVKTGFILHGTGHTLSEEAGSYVGTFQLLGGDLVFHLFEANL